MKTKIKYIILLLLVIQTGYAQEANKFTVKAPDKTFIGAILEPGSINSDAHQFLDVLLNPITIVFFCFWREVPKKRDGLIFCPK